MAKHHFYFPKVAQGDSQEYLLWLSWQSISSLTEVQSDIQGKETRDIWLLIQCFPSIWERVCPQMMWEVGPLSILVRVVHAYLRCCHLGVLVEGGSCSLTLPELHVRPPKAQSPTFPASSALRCVGSDVTGLWGGGGRWEMVGWWWGRGGERGT